jgi:hypothetical protein
MPPATSKATRHSFASAGPPRPGAFRPTGAPLRITSRGMNDAVIRTARPPRVQPRTAGAAVVFRQLTYSGLSFITAYAQFSEGVLEGLEDSLKSAWSLLSHDMWQGRTYTELATTVMALGMIQPFNIPVGLADARAFDRRWGTHVAQRQLDIMQAINKLVLDAPRWTPRQWGHAVGRVVGDIVLAKGAGAAVKLTVGVAVSETVHLRTIATQLEKLGTVTASTNKLAKARAIVPVYARFTMVRTAIPFLDVSTKVNGASFWSGLEKLNATGSAAEHAQVLARASGRQSLEMTRGGAWLDRQTGMFGQQLDWVTQLRPQWGRLSGRFAAKARGTVDMYRGPRYAGPNSVWEQFERDPLEASRKAGRVTDIRVIDVPKK